MAICTNEMNSQTKPLSYRCLYKLCKCVPSYFNSHEELLKQTQDIESKFSGQDADEQLSRIHWLLIQSPWTKQIIQFIYICKLSPNHCLVVYNLISVYYIHIPCSFMLH